MASISGLASFMNCISVNRNPNRLISQVYGSFTVNSCNRVSITNRNPIHIGILRENRFYKAVELDTFVTSDDEDEMSEGFFEAIEELERMTREPSDVLEEMNSRLSARENYNSFWSTFLKKEETHGVLWKCDCSSCGYGVLRRGVGYENDDNQGRKGGPTGYLAWKMMEDGNYTDAIKLVINIKESGLKPEVYSYLIAMTAVVKELNEFGKALRKLKAFTKSGLSSDLDTHDTQLIQNYQTTLLEDGVRLSNWVIEEGGLSFHGVVYERLLAMYICAGRGVEAEGQLWKMKLVGKEADGNLYDIVLAICASQKEINAISRLLTRMEVTSLLNKKKTLTWLLRGYIKGSHYVDAAEVVNKMLNLGVYPEFLDRAAVLQGLRKRINQKGILESYFKLCKRLSDAGSLQPEVKAIK
ncbi:unnamed protein product [Lactuca virosa]|uniref:Pentacotripeptide-repeat region of PRORP domain-containing protein n=1 Tax=Lactuca virosa TaxID=75947 RepID=A0AAU9LR44_9ASTR|nr:unnamed protein product [Lactuca virosa]